MRRSFAALAALVSAIVLTMPAAAFADVSTAQGKITLEGVMPPMRYIILSTSGQITEIISNTTDNVIPVAYYGSLQGPQAVVTKSLLNKYTSLISKMSLSDGNYPITPVGQAPSNAEQPKAGILAFIERPKLLSSIL